ncbi:cell surface glycoprotein CD200 receptor 1 [Trachinotus anak]|uniref:cell surface glycoprotein CD200 receptor 1 n=1 Tax=Trachinotus anak TaxID=443729 RepID=UPI0039F1B3DE
MRDVMWIYVMMIFLVSEAWSLEPVTRNFAFNLGSDVNLPCSDKTLSETIYVIWKIKMKYKSCKIAFSNNGEASEDDCNDGKSLQNTTRFPSNLHIPNFSANDVGVYLCELAFNGGVENYVTTVSITVPPRISAWIEHRDNKMVAVCKAEGGKPAANISWSYNGNSIYRETAPGSDGFITAESQLDLPEGMDTENLTCAIRHLYWEKAMILIPKPKRDQTTGNFRWLMVPVVVVATVLLLGFLFFAQKKLPMLRRCQQSDMSSSTPSKSPPTEDVEEVEPYASYVQRVNSIYN